MPLRPCLDCHRLSPNSRCPEHAKARDRARGTTTQRGLGWQHQQQRKALLAADTSGACPRCGEAYTLDNPATGEHSVPRVRGGRRTDGLLCRRCNSSAGGRMPESHTVRP